MIERAFIHVDGPTGAGKTLLIEHLIRSSRVMPLITARCVMDNDLDRDEETAEADDDELARYRQAGAEFVGRYRFPPSEEQSDGLFSTEIMTEYSMGVILEGDLPHDIYADIHIYVAPAIAKGSSLLKRVKIDQSEGYRRFSEAWEKILQSPDTFEAFARRLVAREFDQAELALPPPIFEELREKLAAELQEDKAKGPPPPVEKWAIAEEFKGIELAQVVVINVRSQDERERAEAMIADLKRIRKDKQIFKDVVGWHGKRWATTMAAVDLSNPKDKDLKRILSRIKRAYPKFP